MTNGKWAVKRTPSNHKAVNKYFRGLTGMDYTSTGKWTDQEGNTYQHNYLIVPKYDGKTSWNFLPIGYTEISWEDFQRDVLGKKSKQQKIIYEIY